MLLRRGIIGNASDNANFPIKKPIILILARTLLPVILFLFGISCSSLLAQFSLDALSKALIAEDRAAIQSCVDEGRRSLGSKAGEPEVPDEYARVSPDWLPLSSELARLGFRRDFKKLESMRWWKIGVDPKTLKAPLRGPASVLSGNIAVARAGLEGADQSLAVAKQAADFLIWAQDQAESGLFPFPAARGTSNERAMEAATSFLAKAEKAGKLDSVVRNDWAFDDMGDGGLQFDNGECGVAMFEIYDFTTDARYLKSARRSADWAAERPLCTNWNYNSFSVEILAKAFEVTQERRYLEKAIDKAILGVLPGQLREGPRAGRWIDPHNARPAYHYIMMRALTRLIDVMPTDAPARVEILRCLSLGLQTRNEEIVTRGVMNKDKAIESLLLVNSVFKADENFLNETRSSEALLILTKLVSEEYRRGKHPLGPREWGLFLEYFAASLREASSKEPPKDK